MLRPNNEPAQRVLDQLERVRRSGSGWSALCPSHDDRNPSLSINETDEGTVLLMCHAGCPTEAVVQTLNMTMSDLWVSGGHVEAEWLFDVGGDDTSPATVATVQQATGCSLDQFAKFKNLPSEWLRAQGLSDFHYSLTDAKALRIPYLGQNAEKLATRHRISLRGPNRFRWKAGDKPSLYGLHRLMSDAHDYVVIVEGESDALTLWYHDVPAVGVPGASTWDDAWASYLERFGTVYVIVEPDQGGATLFKSLRESKLVDRLELVEFTDFDDVSELHLDDPDRFKERFRGELQRSTPLAAALAASREAEREDLYKQCKELAGDHDILARYAEEMTRRGVVGQAKVLKLLDLALTSRFNDRPVSVAIKGVSSGGKSFLVAETLRFFPRSAYYELTAMSQKALAYSKEPLKHRYLVLYEAGGLPSEVGTYLVRSLLSEGKLRYETVIKTTRGLEAKLIEREGPTGLILTTTSVKLHPENETRLLSVLVKDSKEQTAAILHAIAAGLDGETRSDLAQWLAVQDWLTLSEHRVAIPFSEALANLIPPVAVRLRRDFSTLLSLIQAHTILHQANRKRDDGGRVVATTQDYEAVRELVVD